MTTKTLYTNPTAAVLPDDKHRYQAQQMDGTWKNVSLPSYWKDCRTTGTVITDISYKYYGVTLGEEVKTITDTKTFLVKT